VPVMYYLLLAQAFLTIGDPSPVAALAGLR